MRGMRDPSQGYPVLGPLTWGLASLVALSLSRADAIDATFVPLDEQDPASWDTALVERGEDSLRRASAGARPGRFQLDAAMHAVHAARRHTGATDWPALDILSRALVEVAPTLGARVARAAMSRRLIASASVSTSSARSTRRPRPGINRSTLSAPTCWSGRDVSMTPALRSAVPWNSPRTKRSAPGSDVEYLELHHYSRPCSIA